jgi:hypothetical protein
MRYSPEFPVCFGSNNKRKRKNIFRVILFLKSEALYMGERANEAICIFMSSLTAISPIPHL